ncbi:MAG: cobalt-precorrin-5B (C(1))-methyltransferase [Spongiibacteraceae bacterium]
MWPESGENKKPLRSGLTTGSCATACSLAAATLLLENKVVNSCDIKLPKGKMVNLKLEECRRLSDISAYASTIKDAGDDPDATHGATIFSIATLNNNIGIEFSAAEGVGTVTREGLMLAVGEPAINPVPRKMITDHLQQIAHNNAYKGGFNVAIGVVNGEEIAKKTMNGRLGILGGLSILGTTGIVRPFSCAAYIASIHQGIDVAKANGVTHMAACTGNTSEIFAQQQFGLNDMSLLEMGDFVGAVFKYLKKEPIGRLSIVGGFGKISKLALGHKDLHSKKSAINFQFLADRAAELGADAAMTKAIKKANTSIETLAICNDLPLGDLICQHAWQHARNAIPAEIELDLWAIDRQGRQVGHYSLTHSHSGGIQ